jgi:hypothetical protein
MRQVTQVTRVERRWPVALSIFVVVSLVASLPARTTVYPPLAYAVTALLIASMLAVAISSAKARWLRIESIVLFVFLAIASFAVVNALRYLLSEMLHPSTTVTGLHLLTSSIGVWVANVLVFSLVYWRVDRGGPEARVNQAGTRADWLFAQEGASEHVPHDWRPIFVDYLFLAFCTATAFSPADAQPLTPRAKLLVMAESIISLVTIIVVASRAINILAT